MRLDETEDMRIKQVVERRVAIPGAVQGMIPRSLGPTTRRARGI